VTAFHFQRALLIAALATALPAQAVIPPPPPGTSLATTTVQSSTVVEISETGTPTVTSTIDVSGAGPVIWDLDVDTLLGHKNSSDLQFTLTSPAGTVVTLASNVWDEATLNLDLDDVFAGTHWDDQANPGGTLPYVTNAGLASEHPYVAFTLASPLAPVEALGAFRGEDPNGTWTLTITDRFDLNAGTLNGWQLTIGTIASLPASITSSGNNPTVTPLPGGTTTTVTSPIVISGASPFVLDVEATTFVRSNNSADIDMTLTSPAGTVVTLNTDNGAIFDNVFNGTVWRDKANPGGTVPYGGPGTVGSNPGLARDHPYVNLVLASPLAPEEPLSAFLGEDPNGTWTLTVRDDRPDAGFGSFDGWSLRVASPDLPLFANGFE